jgi:uncharacterized protein YciI
VNKDIEAKEEAETLGMVIYYLGLLKRGLAWTPEDTQEVDDLQEAHLENIQRMVETGKLVLVGPFIDDGDLRGAYVFKVGSLKEALELTNTDPMVKSGRLIFEIHPWMIQKGILP